MRLLTVLAIASSLLLAGCGDDDPEPASQAVPERPAMDTSPGDTAPAVPGTSVAETGGGDVEEAQGGDAAGPSSRPSTDGAGQAPEPAAGPGSEAATGADESARRGRLYTVQVGAFTDPETARTWQQRLASQGLPVWIAVAELEGETFYRLRVGAVPTVSEARRLGGLIGQRYEWPVWVAPVTPADRIPSGAVETTRRLLNGG